MGCGTWTQGWCGQSACPQPGQLPDRSPAPLYEGHGPFGDASREGDIFTVSIGTNVDLPNAAELYGITGIAIREVGNRPCQVELFGGLLDPRHGPDTCGLGEVFLRNCNVEGPNLFIDWEIAKFDTENQKNRFMRGIKVCREEMAGLGDRWGREVKGLQIFPAEVTSTGGVIDRDVTKRFARANCEDWIRPVFCPDREIVTALEMHTNEGENQFVGIMPVCKPIHTVPDFRNGPYKDKTGY
jgi:hypothetical protein